MKTSIIVIGDELLIGQTIDTNSAFIAKNFAKLGLSINQRLVIADQKDSIIESLDYLIPKSDIIIMTGGLGPTKDDITKKTIANYMGVKMVRNQDVYLHVKNFFESRGRPLLPENESQSDIPSNAELLFNDLGTAPGMWIHFKDTIIVSLPGVPHEMEFLIQNRVIPKLSNIYQQAAIEYQYIQTAGIGESFLAKAIEDIENSLPSQIKLAYLPKPFRVNLRLSTQQQYASEAYMISQQIIQRLGDHVYGTYDASIFEISRYIDPIEKFNVLILDNGTEGWLYNQLIKYHSNPNLNFTSVSGNFSELMGWNIDIDNESTFDHLKKELLISKKYSHIILIDSILEAQGKKGKTAKFVIINENEVNINTADLFYSKSVNTEALSAIICFEMIKMWKKQSKE